MSLEKIMKELKQEYLQDLPQRILSLQQSFSTQDYIFIREEFHKLKGTGKTYGIPEISILAEAIEHICVNAPKNIPAAFPPALKLLQNIHQSRSQNLALNLELTQEFQDIQKYL